MTYFVFGETTEPKKDSIFTNANLLSFELMRMLGEDERFKDITQADILDFSLVLLHIIMLRAREENQFKDTLNPVIDDYGELKDFAALVINKCRRMNYLFNRDMDEIEKEWKGYSWEK